MGHTRYFFPTLGCSRSQMRKSTLSLNAGLGCCMSVFMRSAAVPSGWVNMACHAFLVMSRVWLLQPQAIPAARFSRSCSDGQVHT